MWEPVDKRAVAVFPFRGKEIIPDHGLDLNLGDEIKIKGECGDWYVGAVIKTEDDDYSQYGIFPKSYVHVQFLVSELVHEDICEELADVAHTWLKIWKKHYVEDQEYQFEVIGKGINEILDGRRTLINETLTKDEVYDLKQKLTNKIDWGNRKLGLDLVPRDENGRIVNSRDCGLIQVYKYHSKSVEQSSSFTTLGRKRLKAQLNSFAHLHLSLKDLNLNLNEELFELYFSLYDNRKQSFISERFLFKHKLEGSSNFLVDISSVSCAFEDINSTDLIDLYIVCHVYRTGKMFMETKGKNGQVYRRPYGCSILNITSDTSEKEVDFKIYSCDEKEFHQIHDFLIKKLYGKVSLTNSVAIVVPKVYVGDIKKIRLENSVFKNSVKVNKIGFPDVFLPGLLRNDLYITILSGEFEKNQKNVEVSLLVLDSMGNWQPNSVYSAVQIQNIGFIGSNNYKSAIYYKINSPKWNETVKISLPLDVFQDCHLRFEFRLCSSKKNEKKLFGFSFLKLKDKHEAIISNNVHQLNILKCGDDSGKLNPIHYLTIDTATGSSQYPKTKETFSIKSFLVSTKLTQNADLVSLLKFKSNPENIPAALENIAKLKGEHLLYFLQDILDVLFSLLSDDNGNSTVNSGPVFVILVNIIKALEDPKYESFKTTLDAYIMDLFSGALVYKAILSTVSHYAETISKAQEEKKAVQIQDTFESSEYLFKFVIKSHFLFSRSTLGTIEDSFIGDVENMFNSFSNALTVETEVETQAKLYLNLHKIYNQLVRVMPKYDITLQVLKVYRAPLRESESSLSPAKLKSLEKLVSSELFSDKDCRSKILQEVCRHLKHYIAHREELQLCTTVMSSILLILYNDSKKDIDVHSDVEILSTTLEMLVQTILILERSSSIVGQLITCLMGLLQLMDSFHYNRVWDEYSTLKPMRDLILRIIFVFRDIIKFPEVYPEYWLQLRLVNNSIMLNALDEISKAMNICVKYDSHLWTQYFSLVVLFLTQSPLQLETFDKKKRLQILDQFGDMRVKICQQFHQMWSHLGPNKIDYLSMVGSFMEASLVPQDEVRNTIIPVFYDLMEAEQTSTGDFKQFEADIIDKMDILIGNGTAGESTYICLFKSILLKKLTACPYMWKQKGIKLIESLANLLERLLDYRENFEISRKMHCMVNLLYLYEKLQTEDIYLRYIYKLHDLHLSCENYIEAGNTLLLHSGICKNEETKENIYLSIIKYFDAGKLFEKGIPIMKELVYQYEKNYQYSKLSHVLQKMSCFYDRILTEYRPEVEFFRVGFFGQGCSSFFRNKEFVYRGLEYEKLGNFIPRILEEYSTDPKAQILGNSNPPDSTILNSEGIYLQICNVRPISNHPILKTKLNDKIKSFYLTNDVQVFQFDRRLANNILNNLNESKENNNQETASNSSDNEFKNMWIERTTLFISNTLPGILRHFEVIEKQVEEISPLRYACERIELVNHQLEEFNETYTAEPMKNLNPFTMKLQGIIDAAVMGGLPKYKEAFFNDGQQSLETNRLRKLISDQLKILEKSLKIHEMLVQQQAPNLEPLHMRLVECLGQMKSLENEFKVKRNSSMRRESNSPSIINSPLPPLPNLPKMTLKSDCTNTNSNRSSISSSGGGYGLIFQEQEEEDEDQVYCHLDGENSINEEHFSSGRMSFNINHNHNHNNPNNNVGHHHTTMSLQRNHHNMKTNSEYIFVPPSQLRNGGNEMFPPPLPTTAAPKIPPKKVNSSQALNMIESSPPVLPKREPKKLNKFGGSYSGTMNTIGIGTPTPPASPIKNSNSNNNNANICGTNSPPPIPPKKPISPVKRISQISEPDYSNGSNNSTNTNTNTNGENNEELNGNISSPTRLDVTATPTATSPTPSSRSSRSSTGLLATLKTTSDENLMMGSLKRRTHKEFYVLPSKET